jgi:hypothetical protein
MHQDPEPIEPCPQLISTKDEKYQQVGLVEMESWRKVVARKDISKWNYSV